MIAAIFAAFFIVLASMDVGYGELIEQCDKAATDGDKILTAYAMESEVIIDDALVPLNDVSENVETNSEAEIEASLAVESVVDTEGERAAILEAEAEADPDANPDAEIVTEIEEASAVGLATASEAEIATEPVTELVAVSVSEAVVTIELEPEHITESESVVVSETDYEALEVARYVMSWQLPSGGWTKNQKAIYQRYWDGAEPIAKYYASDEMTPLGTIDNDATVNEIRYLAEVYQNSEDAEVKTSINKGLAFLLEMQYESGAFPQVYPYQDHACSDYENMATFNDDATTNVLWLYQDILKGRKNFGSNLVDADMKQRIKVAYDKAIDYILESQIIVNGQLTGWCAQHDPVTYEPVEGRAFEPVSISGQESVSVARFLESVKGTHPGAKESVDGFVEWLKLVANDNMRYDRYTKTNQYFDYSEGDYMWYRFYEIGTNKGLFADSDGTIYYDFLDVSEERRKNYGYAGDWGEYFIQ